MASVPDQGKVRRGLAREDLFTVVVDNFQTDTADYADLLLPSTMQIEHADLHFAYGHLYLNWNEPAVAAPGECLPNTEIFRRLARRLGVTEPCVYDSDEDLARAVLASGDPALAGITLERLRRDGWARLSVPTPFVPFADGFPTPSGKLEFVSPRMIEAGLDPVPDLHATLRGGPARHRAGRALSAGPAGAGLALLPQFDVLQQSRAARSARDRRPSCCTPPTPPRAASSRAMPPACTTTAASSARPSR